MAQAREIFVPFYPLIYFSHTNAKKKKSEKLGIPSLLWLSHTLQGGLAKERTLIIAFIIFLDILIMNSLGHFNTTAEGRRPGFPKQLGRKNGEKKFVLSLLFV